MTDDKNGMKRYTGKLQKGSKYSVRTWGREAGEDKDSYKTYSGMYNGVNSKGHATFLDDNGEEVRALGSLSVTPEELEGSESLYYYNEPEKATEVPAQRADSTSVSEGSGKASDKSFNDYKQIAKGASMQKKL